MNNKIILEAEASHLATMSNIELSLYSDTLRQEGYPIIVSLCGREYLLSMPFEEFVDQHRDYLEKYIVAACPAIQIVYQYEIDAYTISELIHKTMFLSSVDLEKLQFALRGAIHPIQVQHIEELCLSVRIYNSIEDYGRECLQHILNNDWIIEEQLLPHINLCSLAMDQLKRKNLYMEQHGDIIYILMRRR